MKLWKKAMYFGYRKQIAKKWIDEFKKVWHIAGPAIITSVSVFSLDCVTAAFAGQLGKLELAAVSEVQNVLLCFVIGIMVCSTSIQLNSHNIALDDSFKFRVEFYDIS